MDGSGPDAGACCIAVALLVLLSIVVSIVIAVSKSSRAKDAAQRYANKPNYKYLGSPDKELHSIAGKFLPLFAATHNFIKGERDGMPFWFGNCSKRHTLAVVIHRKRIVIPIELQFHKGIKTLVVLARKAVNSTGKQLSGGCVLFSDDVAYASLVVKNCNFTSLSQLGIQEMVMSNEVVVCIFAPQLEPTSYSNIERSLFSVISDIQEV